MKTLKTIQNYKHEAVIKRFNKEFKTDKGQQVFEDLMIFFWASKKHDLEKRQSPKNKKLSFFYIMDEEMRGIDQMWHLFLLYTKDYMCFCQKYFGEYIHHVPDIVPGMKKQTKRAFTQNLERFLDYNYDLLGEKTIRRWFNHFSSNELINN